MKHHTLLKRFFLSLACTLPVLLLSPWSPLRGAASTPTASNSRGVYDVRALGAKGDGVTLDTDAINRAIEIASSAGGGTVVFPAGTYSSLSIHLKSNITLDLEPGATLLAAPSGNGVAYDAAEPNPSAANYQDFGHTHFHNSLIWGEGLENVAIVGQGRILGRGLSRDNSARDTGQGNKSISLKLCHNVILRDITIQHGGWFGILATGVDNLTIDNLKIDTNRDGMDIDCCRNVRVSNCFVNSPNDDGICLKSSYGLGFARATENVTITNCQVSGYEEGSLLDSTVRRRSPGGYGRIKFGTETNGGFKNITISNCVFDDCQGLALETVDGASLEDVTISNITMRDIANAPIFLRLGRRMRGPAGTPVGTLRRVSISNVVVYNSAATSASLITGIPGHDIEDVTLSNIQIWAHGGRPKADAGIKPPEAEADYPDPGFFGTMPACGFFIRHVNGITLDNIQVHTLTADQRPAFVLNDVTDSDFRQVKFLRQPGVPVFALTNVKGLQAHEVEGMADTQKDQVGQGIL